MKVDRQNKSQSSFFEDVYEVVRTIPKGRVTSYGAIAAYLGTRLSARMVGWALHGAPATVPAHRVVNRRGLLTGKHHFKTPTEMKRKLMREGVRVKDDCVTEFATLFWDPAGALQISKSAKARKR